VKNLALIAFLVFSFSLQSQAWEKIFSCNNETFVIDRDCSWQGEFPRKYNCNYQMVFNDRNVLDFLTKDTYTTFNNGVVAVKALDGYGRFETDAPNGFKLGVTAVANSSALKVNFYTYYHGTLIDRKNWVFENCSLVNRY